MRRPDFFLIGAPKCGTSSLAAWLAAHPQVYMAPEKEPHYFSPDHGLPGVHSLAEYERLFAAAGPSHAAVGEGSTRYLFSQAAVPQILRYAPAARFIVMLRNPLQMAPSLHQQYVFQYNENVDDFARAWRLQPERELGRAVTPLCQDPRLLLYGPICRLGEQLQRLYGLVPRERVLVLWLEDVIADPRREYLRTLAFLGVPDDGRSDFAAVNRARATRSLLLRKALRSVSMLLRRARIPRPRTGVLGPLHRLNERPASVRPLAPEMEHELAAYFRDDVRLLAQLTGRDLSHWLSP